MVGIEVIIEVIVILLFSIIVGFGLIKFYFYLFRRRLINSSEKIINNQNIPNSREFFKNNTQLSEGDDQPKRVGAISQEEKTLNSQPLPLDYNVLKEDLEED